MTTNKNRDNFDILVNSPAELSAAYASWYKQTLTNPGIPWGIPAIDKYVIPMRPGDLVGLVARPGHGKSSLMAYLARAEAKRIVERGKAGEEVIVYVTWESSAEEVETFFLSDGRWSASDIAWGRVPYEDIARRLVKRAQFPVWTIGHSIAKAGRPMPRMTLPAVLGAIESMQADYGIRPVLLLFDYLQLIPVANARNRIEQVLEAPPLIKELAMRVGVPAVCGVQASRQVDERKWKVPQPYDCQWGCIAGDVEIIDAETGYSMTIAEIYANWSGRLSLHSLDMESLRLKRGSFATKIKRNPQEQIYKLDCGTSGTIRANSRHQFLTPDGWKETCELEIGDLVARANNLPINTDSAISNDLALIIGMLLGDGVMVRTLTLSNSDHELHRAFSDAVIREWDGELETSLRKQTMWDVWDATIRRADGRIFPHGNRALNLFKKLGLFGQTAANKHVPRFRLGDSQAASLLGGLFATDGCVTFRNKRPQVSFFSCSRQLVSDVQNLLLRLGITSGIRAQEKDRKMKLWILRVCGYDLRKFSDLVEIPGRKGRVLSSFFDAHSKDFGRSMGDLLPAEWNLEAIEIIKRHHLRSRFNNVKGRAITRGRMLQIAETIDSAQLRKFANSQIGWVAVKNIKPDGFEHTYDLHVPNTENYIANGFVTHNSSIEQAADKLFGLWRPIRTEPIGAEPIEIEYTEDNRTAVLDITDTLLIMQMLKQRGDAGRKTWGLHFAPQYLRLEEMRRIDPYELETGGDHE